jgi:hypothetical protein
MKKLITIIIMFLSIPVYSQYMSVTAFPSDNSLLLGSENVDGKGWGFHFGVFYQIGATQYPYVYRSPYDYLNRIGINYGFLKSGIVVGAGIKADVVNFFEPQYYPDFFVKLQPIKLITQKRNIWDVSLTLNYSDKPYVGFGVSIPLNNKY